GKKETVTVVVAGDVEAPVVSESDVLHAEVRRHRAVARPGVGANPERRAKVEGPQRRAVGEERRRERLAGVHRDELIAIDDVAAVGPGVAGRGADAPLDLATGVHGDEVAARPAAEQL